MSGSVTPITARRDKLQEQISAELVANGHAFASADTVDADMWRRCARAAARSLGRPVRTVQLRDGVAAGLTDWPATPAEEAVQAQVMRRVVEGVAEAVAEPNAQPPTLRPVD